MAYFNKFPLMAYDTVGKGEYKLVTNILKRVKLRSSLKNGLMLFDKYDVVAGESPEDIKKIINLFRFHMLPELRGNAARFLTIPSEFDIHYMFMGEDGAATENTYYHKISTCVLQSLSVDYTPNGVKSFSNGAPTQINLSLSFKETEMMTKEMVNEGF